MKRITMLPFIVMLGAKSQARVSLMPTPIPAPQEVQEAIANSAPQVADPEGIKVKRNQNKPGRTNPQISNLPSEYGHREQIPFQEAPIIQPSENPGLKMDDLSSGDILSAQILESLLAYPGAKSPIRALITKGKLKGGILTGEATLEKNSKRILIQFQKIRKPREQDTYEMQASGLDGQGLLGLEGEYHSDEPWFFAGEFISAAASGLTDSSIERSQNNLGNYVEAPGIGNATKRAGAQAASRTADHFAEKVKTASEYASLIGPIQIQVLILSSPKLIK